MKPVFFLMQIRSHPPRKPGQSSSAPGCTLTLVAAHPNCHTLQLPHRHWMGPQGQSSPTQPTSPRPTLGAAPEEGPGHSQPRDC